MSLSTVVSSSGSVVPSARTAALLALPVVVLSVMALINRGDAWLVDTPLWDLQNTTNLLRTVAALVIGTGLQWLLYAILGLMLATLWPRHWVGALVGVTLTALLVVILRAPPGANGLDLVGPLLSGSIGVACGRITGSMLRGTLLSLTVVGVLGIGLAALLWQALDTAPGVAMNQQIGTAERVHLTNLLRNNSPRLLRPGQTNQLTLSDAELNALLTWGLSLGSSDRAAMVAIDGGVAQVNATVGLPGLGDARYLNLSATGSADVFFGKASLQLDALRIGNIKLPRWSLDLITPMLITKINSDPRARALLEAFESVELEHRAVSATYGRLELGGELRDDVFGSLGNEQDSAAFRAALRAQLGSIEALALDIPSFADPFKFQLRGAFALARQRSYADGASPVLENRAALIALGILFGHRRIASVVAELQNETLPSLPRSQHPRIEQRVDLAQHFFTSAGLTVLTTQAVGIDIGRLKEELDASNRGGSGFSFADLAADHAGVRLAEAATAGMREAFAVQEALANLAQPDEVVPQLLDLPEGLSLSVFEERFGGVDGERYQELVDLIERRIGALPVYAEST